MIEVTITIVEANAMALTDTAFAPTALEVAKYLELERAAIAVTLPMDFLSFSYLSEFRQANGMAAFQDSEDAYQWLKLQGHLDA